MKITVSFCGEVVYERLWVERVALDDYGLLLVYDHGEVVYRCRLYVETTFSITDSEG